MTASGSRGNQKSVRHVQLPHACCSLLADSLSSTDCSRYDSPLTHFSILVGRLKKMTRLFAGTQFDRPPHCEVCDKLEEECVCPPPLEPEPFRIPPEKQTAILSIEKRKKGKSVTVIRGLVKDGNDLPALLTQLKNKCGAGGSVQDDHLEIQGRKLNQVRDVLKTIGFKVKGA